MNLIHIKRKLQHYPPVKVIPKNELGRGDSLVRGTA